VHSRYRSAVSVGSAAASWVPSPRRSLNTHRRRHPTRLVYDKDQPCWIHRNTTLWTSESSSLETRRNGLINAYGRGQRTPFTLQSD